jgi:hypothetical protein
MDGLELTMKCSKLLNKPYSTDDVFSISTISNSSRTSSDDNTFINTNLADNEIDLTRNRIKEGW